MSEFDNLKKMLAERIKKKQESQEYNPDKLPYVADKAKEFEKGFKNEEIKRMGSSVDSEKSEMVKEKEVEQKDLVEPSKGKAFEESFKKDKFSGIKKLFGK